MKSILKTRLIILWMLSMGCAGYPVKEQRQVSKELQSAHFDAVAKHLDLGGTMYLYADIDGDLQRLADLIQQLLKKATQDEAVSVLRSLDVRKIADRLGLQKIKALGLSSYRDGPVFRNRAFVYHQGDQKGLLRVLGAQPHDFEIARLAPQDVDWVFENDLQLRAVYEVIAAILEDIQGPEAKNTLAVLDEKIPGLSISYKQLVDQLDTRVVGVLRIHSDRSLAVPGENFKIPAFDLLLGIDRLGILFDALAEALKLPIVEQGDLSRMEIPWPVPGDLGSLKPALAKDKKTNRMFFTIGSEFLLEYFSNKTGLEKDPFFQKAIQGLDLRGNGLSYVSPKLVPKLQKLFDEIGKSDPEIKYALEFWTALLPDPNLPSASGYINLPEGILFTSNTTSSHKSTLLTLVYANPMMMGIMAAVAIPAFINYNRKSKTSMVHEELDRCYKSMVDAFEKPGSAVSRKFPPTMAEPICPGNKTKQTLNGDSDVFNQESFQKKAPGEVFFLIGFSIPDASFACFQLTSDAPGEKPKEGQGFTCHAWTDLDDDDQPAHWTKVGTYRTNLQMFEGGRVSHDPVSDDF